MARLTHLQVMDSWRGRSTGGVIDAECGRRVSMMATASNVASITCKKCCVAGMERIMDNDYEGKTVSR